MSAIEIPSNVADKMNAEHHIRSFALDRAIQYLSNRQGMSKAASIVEYAKEFEQYLQRG